jgi:hypothetical protein
MCTLAEPPPGISMDWLHPDLTFLLIWGLFGTFLFGVLLAVVYSSPDSENTWLSRKQAALLVLGGYVCIVLMIPYWAGVLTPSANALDAWYQREQGLLSPACVSTVLTPAYDTASNALKAQTDSVLAVLFVLGWLCAGVASWSRDIRRSSLWR